MNFALTEDQLMVREMVRKFVRDRVTPNAHAWSEQRSLPSSIFAELRELGLLGEAATDLDAESFVVVLEEIARGDAALALVVATHEAALTLASSPRSGIGTLALSGIACAAGYASWLVCDDGDDDWEAPAGSALDGLGMWAAGLCHVDLPGDAPPQWLIWNAAIAVGVARAALEEATRYSGEREQFGKPIAAYQAIQFKLADMATAVDAARLLATHAATNAVPAADALRFAADTVTYVTDEAVQIHGGYGYVREYPVERYYRDARWFPIWVAP